MNFGSFGELTGGPGAAGEHACARCAGRNSRDTDGLRHHRNSSMGRLGGRIGPGERDNTLGDIRPSGGMRAARVLSHKRLSTRLHEAFLRPPHTGLRPAAPAHNLIGGVFLRSTERSRPARHAYAARRDSADRGQTAAINRLESTGIRFACARPACNEPDGDPFQDSNVTFDPIAGEDNELNDRWPEIQLAQIVLNPNAAASEIDVALNTVAARARPFVASPGSVPPVARLPMAAFLISIQKRRAQEGDASRLRNDNLRWEGDGLEHID